MLEVPVEKEHTLLQEEKKGEKKAFIKQFVWLATVVFVSASLCNVEALSIVSMIYSI